MACRVARPPVQAKNHWPVHPLILFHMWTLEPLPASDSLAHVQADIGVNLRVSAATSALPGTAVQSERLAHSWFSAIHSDASSGVAKGSSQRWACSTMRFLPGWMRTGSHPYSAAGGCTAPHSHPPSATGNCQITQSLRSAKVNSVGRSVASVMGPIRFGSLMEHTLSNPRYRFLASHLMLLFRSILADRIPRPRRMVCPRRPYTRGRPGATACSYCSATRRNEQR